MKIFVTGICGRLGRALAAEVPAQGHTILGLDMQPWPSDRPLPAGVETAVGSYEDIAVVEPLLKSCDAMIHTAGPHGGFIKKLPLSDFIHSNVESVAHLLDAAVRVGVRRVALSSTMEILVGDDWTSSGAAVLDEESSPRADNPYSLSRLLQEHLAREFCRKNSISIASLRYMAFGYSEDFELGLRLLAHALSTRDIARAAILAITRGEWSGDVFHIGPQTPLTNRDIIAAMTQPETVLEKYYPGAVPIVRGRGLKITADYFWPVTSIRKARMMLGWEPEYTFEQWLLANGWKKPS